jgi:hypothetical protein
MAAGNVSAGRHERVLSGAKSRGETDGSAFPMMWHLGCFKNRFINIS